MRTLGVSYALDTGFAASSSTPPWDLAVRSGRLTTARLRVTVENHGGDKRFVRMAGSVLPSGLSTAALVACLGLAAGFALVKPLVALAACAAAVVLAGWMGFGLFRAASLVATITQYVMVTRPGCSMTEPKEERVARVVRPQKAVEAEGTEAVADAAPEIETAAA